MSALLTLWCQSLWVCEESLALLPPAGREERPGVGLRAPALHPLSGGLFPHLIPPPYGYVLAGELLV